ncbi:hypothetical protein Syun_004184 [Stephania yunnanensis]|uniref:Uncharacterized protein n=1 Tax=Stephania yunnanensis TaxID=152371 RepID=A0AAP0Q0I6_9MAGN
MFVYLDKFIVNKQRFQLYDFEEEYENEEEVENEISKGVKNYVLRKKNFVKEKAFDKFKKDIERGRKLVTDKRFIDTRNDRLLTRDCNHLDLEDVPSVKGCDILVKEFYANAYGSDSKTKSRVKGRIVDYSAIKATDYILRWTIHGGVNVGLYEFNYAQSSENYEESRTGVLEPEDFSKEDSQDGESSVKKTLKTRLRGSNFNHYDLATSNQSDMIDLVEDDDDDDATLG